jgi:simple sugar transport system ATP-binding protein/ribose transport system ATP-binding protein
VSHRGIDLRVEGISKRFGETRALRSVSLAIRPGTVHALVGENGAGKSTLGKVISGLIQPDQGVVFIDERPVELRSPRAALEAGIAAIAQELSLVPALTAAENVLLGVEPRRMGLVDRSAMRARYRAVSDGVGFDVPASQPVRTLSVAARQQVEVLRALSRDARLIVMDEPSARLSGEDVAKLRALIRRLADGGRSILLISHFLREVLDVADAVTVLRDGEVVRHGPTANETELSLIEAMLGRKLGAQFPDKQPPGPDAPVVLKVEGLTGSGFRDVSLEVRRGEILGLAGLVGAGRSELARGILGATPLRAGTVSVSGRTLLARSPRDARRRGVLIVPESRRDQGLFPLRPARENVSIASLEDLSRLGMVGTTRERSVTGELMRRVQVDAAGDAPVSQLSGGNQQKLLFARSMMARPVLLLADEPTRGVDVGAKRAIYELLCALAADGQAILLISSEMEEILGLSHRVLVMRGGEVVADLRGEAVAESAILNAIFAAPVGGAAVA